MKIIQLLPELNEGGVERGTVELSRELVKLGRESIVISNGGKLVQEIENHGGKHIIFDLCSKNPLTAYWRIMKLRQILKDLDPNIVHARSRIPAWLTYLANKKLHIPFITTIHGFNSISSYSAIMTKGDSVICVSSSIKEYIKVHYKVDDSRIHIIPRGIDLKKFNPQNINDEFIKKFKNLYKLENSFVITTVGRITQLKDLETFIQAIAIIKQKIPDAKGVIVGGVREDKEKYFRSLKNLVTHLNLEENIIFTGSQYEVSQIYALSDVVVSSSKKPESFGRSVAEAIAMNTPVVATNHGGVLDIIDVGIAGYLFESMKVSNLAESILKAQHLSFDGYKIISNKFSLDVMIKKTIKVYENV